MKHLKSILATIAFVMAIFLAQAMHSSDDNARLFGKQIDPITQAVTWVEITNLDEEDYTCSPNPEETCTSQLVNDDPVMGIEVSGTQQPGNFFLY
ncbi:DUF6520 family protein [Fulvivirgaceae bacterium LMO-SS25]